MLDVTGYRYTGRTKFNIGQEGMTKETSLCPDKKQAAAILAENLSAISALQEKLYAEKKEGVVFVFQAMDAAGKDGTIRVVFGPMSTHGVREAAFKTPSKAELGHDFLWRIVKELPEKGEIAIFNRSHYEDVLIGRVHELYRGQAHADRIKEDKVIETRYKDIRNFEKYLFHNSIRVVKIFLNVSRAEQSKRFLARMETPEKNWKVSAGDLAECQYWDAYQAAFEDCINATACKEAPWYAVPADHKWYMRLVVSEIVRQTLEEMDPKFPVLPEEEIARFDDYKKQLYVAEQSRQPKNKETKEKAETKQETAGEEA